MSRGATQPNPEQVANAVADWLQQEVVSSDDGRNAYLSEFLDRRDDFYKPFDDHSNYQAQKAKSHHDRLIQWVSPYNQTDLRHNDWFVGRIIFACLMDVSGSYRKQCFLEAADSTDYIARRRDQGPNGINMIELASEELATDRIDIVNALIPDERIDYIIDRTLTTNTKSLGLHESLHPPASAMRLNTKGSLAKPDDAPVIAMQEAQKLWVGLALAHVVVAASFRDHDYSKVPLLEPVSITDVTKIIYPFVRT